MMKDLSEYLKKIDDFSLFSAIKIANFRIKKQLNYQLILQNNLGL